MATKPTRILRDLRWAYLHAEDGTATTPERERFRKMAQTDLKGFMGLLERHEKEWKERKAERAAKAERDRPAEGAKSPAAAEMVPESDQALIARVDEWLAEHGVPQ